MITFLFYFFIFIFLNIVFLFLFLFMYTDGTQFSPDVTKDDTFHVFDPEVCR